jgi:hypothetical protein
MRTAPEIVGMTRCGECRQAFDATQAQEVAKRAGFFVYCCQKCAARADDRGKQNVKPYLAAAQGQAELAQLMVIDMVVRAEREGVEDVGAVASLCDYQGDRADFLDHYERRSRKAFKSTLTKFQDLLTILDGPDVLTLKSIPRELIRGDSIRARARARLKVNEPATASEPAVQTPRDVNADDAAAAVRFSTPVGRASSLWLLIALAFISGASMALAIALLVLR